MTLQRRPKPAEDIQKILLIELLGFKVLPLSHVWVASVVKPHGKTYSGPRKQTRLKGAGGGRRLLARLCLFQSSFKSLVKDEVFLAAGLSGSVDSTNLLLRRAGDEHGRLTPRSADKHL